MSHGIIKVLVKIMVLFGSLIFYGIEYYRGPKLGP